MDSDLMLVAGTILVIVLFVLLFLALRLTKRTSFFEQQHRVMQASLDDIGNLLSDDGAEEIVGSKETEKEEEDEGREVAEVDVKEEAKDKEDVK